ncbi:hypothetical protein M472_07570 [Sphingobacterium paucimobilis HER1398]|uniref:Uncharacterized protein n=1 Tax=Sphingobacterium paucimobilis HER1398 TaxID=1346330 RepID=U2HT08_9SPHI|nr:hypothetical protein M472_07570 [Sphingobacterium paucimobilis HER1398]
MLAYFYLFDHVSHDVGINGMFFAKKDKKPINTVTINKERPSVTDGLLIF